MEYFFLAALLLALTMFCFFGWLRSRSSTVDNVRTAGRVSLGAFAFFLVCLLAYTAERSFHTVPTNHVGIVTIFDKISGRTGDGLVSIVPWGDLTVESAQVQRADYNLVNIPSNENQSLSGRIVIQYHVDAKKVVPLYSEYGANWYQSLVDPFIQTVVDNVAGGHAAVDLHNHPATIGKKIAASLRTALSSKAHGSDVDIVSVNPHFKLPDPLIAQILRKQVAIQEADTETNKVAIATAKGNQSYQLALGKARANRALSASITPKLIQYEALQHLQSNVRVCVVPSGTTVLNPCSVVGSAGK